MVAAPVGGLGQVVKGGHMVGQHLLARHVSTPTLVQLTQPLDSTERATQHKAMRRKRDEGAAG